MTRILVIEDSPELRALEQDLLDAHGYQVLLAGGMDGVGLARHEHPDLILLDLILEEGVRGEAVYAALRADPDTRAIPVIIVSASSRAIHIGAELGAEAVIQKPFDVQSLLDYIEDVLLNAQERKDHHGHQ